MENSTPTVAQIVDRFLSTGSTAGADPATLAKAVDDRIRRETQLSLKKTLLLVRRFVTYAEPLEGILRLTAYRALARVTHMGAQHQEAERAYLTARSLAMVDPLVRARIDRALIDVYMYMGRFDESRRRARMALAAFKRLGAVADVAMTQVNLGNLAHRQDRHKDAEHLYDEAGRYFSSINDDLSFARCLYNRANTLVQLCEFDLAEELYNQSEKIYRSKECELDATDSRYGLAWLRMLRGEFHVALLELTECERAYNRIGQPKGAALCELDRAEVYLGLGLLSDAHGAAKSAEGRFKQLGHRYELSKARFFRAKASFGLGALIEARKSLELATTGFQSEQNEGFLGATRLLRSQMAQTRAEQIASIRQAQANFSRAQLPLWEAVCDLHRVSERRFARSALRRLEKNPAVQSVPQLYAWWNTARGDHEEQLGNTPAARKYWQAAADRLDLVRAHLPPLDLRSKFATSTVAPHSKLVESQLAEDVASAAAWSERLHTAGLWATISPLTVSNAERSQAEQALFQLARHVAMMTRHIGGYSGERGNVSAESQRGLSRLQRRVRLEMAALEKHSHTAVDSVEQLCLAFRHVSRNTPIIQFHLSGDDILAFVHECGDTRLARFTGGRNAIKMATRQWRFLLESELLAQQGRSRSQQSAENSFLQKLGKMLWQPLELSSHAGPVLLIPEGDLANLPWQALRPMGVPLCEQHSFIVAPSLRHYLHARKSVVTENEVHLFQGHANDLPKAAEELRHIADRAGSLARIHDPATRDDWPCEGEARLWHYAGHAVFRADNPFYSYLSLADGPLFAADLRLRQTKVGLVTLAACRSGQNINLPGEESIGLVRSLLEMGARQVIAGHWPVADNSTALWMNVFYDEYFSGQSAMESMKVAISAVRESFPSAYHWAAFSLFGADE